MRSRAPAIASVTARKPRSSLLSAAPCPARASAEASSPLPSNPSSAALSIHPLRSPSRSLDIELGIAGGGGHAVAPLGRDDAELGRLLEDRLAPLAEGIDDRLGHAHDLERAVLALELDLVAELLQPGAQVGVVDRPDDRVIRPDLVGVQRLPFAVGHLGRLAMTAVDMGLRIERATGVVLEQRINEACRSAPAPCDPRRPCALRRDSSRPRPWFSGPRPCWRRAPACRRRHRP